MRETVTSDGSGNSVTKRSVTGSDGQQKTVYTAQSADGQTVQYQTSAGGQSFAGKGGVEGWWSRLWSW